MAWITGRKSDQSIIEVHLKSPDWTLAELEQVIPINYGGAVNDYSFYQMDATDEARIRDKWEYELVWLGSNIDDIDWTPETNKRWIKMSADKDEIVDDGVETVNLTLEVWKADESGIDTDLNITADIPILTPTGERWVKATVTNGTLTKSFKTTKSGTWIFPSRAKRFTSTKGQKARVMNQIILQVVETGVFD